MNRDTKLYCPSESCMFEGPISEWKPYHCACDRCAGITEYTCPRCHSHYNDYEYDLEEPPDWVVDDE